MRNLFLFILLVILLAGAAFFERRSVLHVLAGTGVFNSMYAQSTVKIPHVTDAASYNIYYSQPGGSFSYSVRNIPNTDSSYTIAYLRKNVSYQYKISALNKSGREIWWSKVSDISDVHPM